MVYNNKYNQNEVKKKRKRTIIRTDRVKDTSNVSKLLEDPFLERLLTAINKHYLEDNK